MAAVRPFSQVMLDNKISLEELKKCWFTQQTDGKYQCNDCKKLLIATSGPTCLYNHLAGKSHESSWLMTILNARKSVRGPMDQFAERSCSKAASNIYQWMEQLVMNDEPFHFVENEYVRKNSKLETISRPTILKYFQKLGPKLQENMKLFIARIEPKRFGLIFDCK